MTEYEKPRILSVTAQHVAELEAENAKLREQLDTAEHNQTRNAREYARMCHENAKLREELAKARDPQRIGGQADPSSFVYALEQLREFRWQHATNDENAIPYINNVAAAHERENAKLRELVWDLYCLAYPRVVEWEVSDAAHERYSPCKRCEELHAGKSPCASTSKDMTEECCKPIQAGIVADRMRELGVEVDA